MTAFTLTRESRQEGLRLLEISYFSHDIGDFPLQVNGYLALPEGEGPFPGILHLHGGAQCADASIATAWAQRGYATLCIDWSIPANNTASPLPTLWPEHFPKIADTEIPIDQAAIGHIVRATRHGIGVLESHPLVDPNRLGMIGISWGGLMTWLVNGTDTRLRTAIPVYGCGLHESRTADPAWLNAFQPARFAASQHGSVFHVNGTHDFFGYLETAEAVLSRVTVPARRLYVPNEDHGLNDQAREAVAAWMDRELKQQLPPPPEPVWSVTSSQPELIAPGSTDSRVYCGSLTDRNRIWRSVTSPDLPEKGDLYATVCYPDGFSCSTPVHPRTPLEPPAAGNLLYDPETDGLDPIFLRWTYENLQVHQPATHVMTYHPPHGIGPNPLAPSLQLFLRVETRPPQTVTSIGFDLTTPLPGTLTVDIYTRTAPDDDGKWSCAPIEVPAHPSEGIDIPLVSFTPVKPKAISLLPEDIRIISITFSSLSESPCECRLQRMRWS